MASHNRCKGCGGFLTAFVIDADGNTVYRCTQLLTARKLDGSNNSGMTECGKFYRNNKDITGQFVHINDRDGVRTVKCEI